MRLQEQRAQFGKTKTVHESARLTFHGVEEFDVYNTSIPFRWKRKEYIFGRVERRYEWARSRVRMFKNTGNDDWTLVSK